MTVQYEQLRSDALLLVESPQKKHTAGMRLFLQSGMAVWMRTASEYLGESRCIPVATRREDHYPFDLRAEAISILAGMILSRPGEEVAL